MIIIHLSEQLAHQSIFIIFLVIPNHANLVVAECTFDRDSCSWRNTSTGDFEWRMATLNRRPSNLPDKTFGAPVGYAYFDIFNSGSRLDIHQFIHFHFFTTKTDSEFDYRLLSYYLNQILGKIE